MVMLLIFKLIEHYYSAHVIKLKGLEHGTGECTVHDSISKSWLVKFMFKKKISKFKSITKNI